MNKLLCTRSIVRDRKIVKNERLIFCFFVFLIIQVALFDCIGLLGIMLFLSNVVLHNDKIKFVEMKTSRATGHLETRISPSTGKQKIFCLCQ